MNPYDAKDRRWILSMFFFVVLFCNNVSTSSSSSVSWAKLNFLSFPVFLGFVLVGLRGNCKISAFGFFLFLVSGKFTDFNIS